jgi:hypothetical protein
MKMDMDLKDVVNAKVFRVQILLYLVTYDMSGTYKFHRGHGGNTCSIFVSKTEAMKLLEKPRQTQYYWYKNKPYEISFVGVGWIQRPWRAQ